MRWGEHGWSADVVDPLALDASFTLFAADPSARVDVARWAHHARRFFDAKLEIVPPKKYPSGEAPERDAFTIEISDRACGGSLEAVTLPISAAPGAKERALEACRAIGGAGMDALVARAARLWQIHDDGSRASLLAAAVLASILLAPILPPDARSILGVKSARELLDKNQRR